MKLSWQPKKLWLKETFSISYGNYDFRNALLISLSYKDKTGFGECVAINYYGINLDEFILKLKEIQTKIEAKEIVHPKEFYHFLTSLNLQSIMYERIAHPNDQYSRLNKTCCYMPLLYIT